MQALGRRLAGPDAAGRAAPAAAIVRRQPNVRLFYRPDFSLHEPTCWTHDRLVGGVARRLGVDSHTLRRWTADARPTAQHMMALLELADSLGLGHLLTASNGRRPAWSER